MKRLFSFFILIIYSSIAYATADRDSLLQALDNAIDQTHLYDAQKHKQIETIKKSFATSYKDLNAQYTNALLLYEAYKIFRFDSAYIYAKRLEKIALQLNDSARISAAKLKLSFILLSAGMFKETSDYLRQINVHTQPDSLKAEYFSLAGRYYYDLADYDNDAFHSPVYIRLGNEHMDSALIFFPPQSFDYLFYEGLKNLKEGKTEKALTNYQTLYTFPHLTDHQLALVTSTLGNIYVKKGAIDKAIEYQIKAAIADIRSATKETYAIFNLAELLFEQGDFKSASLYIEKAINDASFYGARQRKVQVSTILPLIEGKKINYVESQRKLWIIYASVVTLFLGALIFLIVVIYRQNNKLKTAKRIITEAHANLREANDKLKEVNAELQHVNSELYGVNAKLLEANKIKEEYIGYFFNINSEFFQKIERFKKSLDQKIADRKLDDIRFIVNNINVKKEKEELLQSFDKVFLKLFPNFVVEFNALFKEDDRIKLKDSELLNTDLRIFALIRMGITENEKIAQILEYSVNTIYAYKTKIKSRAIVAKDEFEKRVMEIKSV